MNRRTFVYGSMMSPLLMAGCRDASSETAGIPRDIPAQNSSHAAKTPKKTSMYGIIGKMNATEGDREKLIEILLNGTQDMPGCKLYAISADNEDANCIWITEIWESEDAHQASLQLPDVQKAIADGKPMIAGFGDRHIVTTVGGFGVN
ncbi:quinol monooxygenase YgiN [Rhodopirellula rubra]|uniref:Quinol monooxygenase YgiN n=1 Tax=Aporhodopirellula rubra TaxID=980271 RepID=A0A7W5E689_9BACT|nr:putative quinol monooxygenase [Aporhodopirellula rubra]MBB3210552.1 quinol monooxygenase YgiN [Aporhodopirellula rubra]